MSIISQLKQSSKGKLTPIGYLWGVEVLKRNTKTCFILQETQGKIHHDVDWTRFIIDRHSTSGTVLMFGAIL